MKKNYEALEELMGALAIGESIEGVMHPETIYEYIEDEKQEVIPVIEAEAFEVFYSKKNRAVKFVFTEMNGDIEVDGHTIRSLKHVHNSIKEMAQILNALQDELKAA